jgi:hypothetical protein
LFAPATLAPDVRESLPAILVPQNDVAGLKLQLGQRLQHLNAVRLIGDVHSRNSGHHFATFESDYGGACSFPGGVQRDLFDDDPLPEGAAFKRARPGIDDGQSGLGQLGFVGRRLRREHRGNEKTDR